MSWAEGNQPSSPVPSRPWWEQSRTQHVIQPQRPRAADDKTGCDYGMHEHCKWSWSVPPPLTDCDAARPVEQQHGHPRRQHQGLHLVAIEICLEVYSVLLYVRQQRLVSNG